MGKRKAVNTKPRKTQSDHPTGIPPGYIPMRFAYSTAVKDKVGYLFGGSLEAKDGTFHSLPRHVGDLWKMDSAQTPHDREWIKVKTTGEKPGARRWHTLSAVGNKLYCYGGEFNHHQLGDMYALDLATNEWSEVKRSVGGAVPSARCGHSATVVGKRIYVFGGFQAAKQFQSMFVFNTSSESWKKVKAPEGPPARSNHTAVSFGRYIFIFGGYSMSESKLLNDLWRFDTKKNEWRRIHAGGHHPPGRCNHTAVAVGRKMIIYGGRRQRNELHVDTWLYDVEQNYWRSAKNLYIVGDGKLVAIGKKLYLFGDGSYFSQPDKFRPYNPDQPTDALQRGDDSGETTGSDPAAYVSFGEGDDPKDPSKFPQDENRRLLSFKYAIVKEVARNPQAAVYDCVRKDNRQHVAVKVVNQYRPPNKTPREAILIRKLQGHPYIQRYHCWYPIRYTRCHALVTGFHQNDKFVVEEEGMHGVRRYMYTFLQALGFMHSLRIVHRDIKVSNICWNTNTKVSTLIDLDVSYNLDRNPQTQMIGTPAYMSPELIQEGVDPEKRKPYGFGIDIWAAGITLAQIMYGYIHDVPSIEEIEGFVETDHYGWGKDHPAVDLMWKMLDPNPKKRLTVKGCLRHPFFHEERSSWSYSGGDELDPAGNLINHHGHAIEGGIAKVGVSASENPSQAALTTTGALSASGGGTSGLGTSGFSTIADTTASSSIADPSYYSYYSGTLSASGSAYYSES